MTDDNRDFSSQSPGMVGRNADEAIKALESYFKPSQNRTLAKLVQSLQDIRTLAFDAQKVDGEHYAKRKAFVVACAKQNLSNYKGALIAAHSMLRAIAEHDSTLPDTLPADEKTEAALSKDSLGKIVHGLFASMAYSKEAFTAEPEAARTSPLRKLSDFAKNVSSADIGHREVGEPWRGLRDLVANNIATRVKGTIKECDSKGTAEERLAFRRVIDGTVISHFHEGVQLMYGARNPGMKR